jgi:predicted RNase H-like HicB family nuclease
MNDQSRDEHYSLVIEWDPDDRIYVVTVPELPGCLTHGVSYEEAIAQARDAIASWLDAARDAGVAIPRPRAYAIT